MERFDKLGRQERISRDVHSISRGQQHVVDTTFSPIVEPKSHFTLDH